MISYTLEDFVNLLNGTPDGRLTRYLRATLPINQLGFRNAKPIGLRPQLKGKPPTEVCPIQQVYEMFIGVYILFIFVYQYQYVYYVYLAKIAFGISVSRCCSSFL